MADDKVRERAAGVSGVDLLELVVEDAGDGNSRDWGVRLDPRIKR